MKLAIFDLDGTLLSVDAGVEWVHFLNQHTDMDMTQDVEQCHQFLSDYRAGNFNVHDFMNFHMRLLARFPRQYLLWQRDCYVEQVIKPKLEASAMGLVNAMKADGYDVILATGTQRFVSEPIAHLFGIETVLATTPVILENGEFSGDHMGDFCYCSSKIDRLMDFLSSKSINVDDLEALVFYTDSITDLPLIEFVEKCHGHVVATNPDPRLKEQAEQRGWSVIEIFHR